MDEEKSGGASIGYEPTPTGADGEERVEYGVLEGGEELKNAALALPGIAVFTPEVGGMLFIDVEEDRR